MGSGFRTFTAGEVLTASNVQNYLQDQVVMTFAGSAARSSAIGTANFEEGMVSYLTDTDKVEAYNGTNWVQVGSSNQGLTLINTTSFSAVASQSVNDVFSATYDNYLILLTQSGSTTNDVNMRMRVGGADNSSTNYVRSYLSQNSTTLTGQLISGESSFRAVAQMRSGQQNFSQMTIINPFATANTTIIQDSTDQVGTTSLLQLRIMHTLTVTTSYTGFTLIAASGNITGSVSTYGFAK